MHPIDDPDRLTGEEPSKIIFKITVSIYKSTYLYRSQGTFLIWVALWILFLFCCCQLLYNLFQLWILHVFHRSHRTNRFEVSVTLNLHCSNFLELHFFNEKMNSSIFQSCSWEWYLFLSALVSLTFVFVDSERLTMTISLFELEQNPH